MPESTLDSLIFDDQPVTPSAAEQPRGPLRIPVPENAQLPEVPVSTNGKSTLDKLVFDEPQEGLETITISLKAFERMMINRGEDPKIIQQRVALHQRKGTLPQLKTISVMDTLRAARKNFGEDFGKNLRAALNVKEIPASLLTLLGDVFLNDQPFPITTQTVEERAQQFEQSSVNQLLEFYSQTYDISSPEGREIFKRFVSEHPSQFLSDVAMIVSPIGSMALKTGRLAPIVARLNASTKLRLLVKTAQAVIDPGMAMDIPLDIAGTVLQKIPDVSLREGINGNMLRLQEKFADDIPMGFPESTIRINDPITVSDEARRIKTSIIGTARTRLNQMESGLDKIAKRTVAGFGGLQDLGTIGDNVFEGFRATIRKFQDEGKKLFDAIDKWDAPADYRQTIATIDGILEKNRGPLSGLDTDISRLENVRERLIEFQDSGQTLREVDFERTKWRENFMKQRASRAEPILPENKVYQFAIYNSLTDDLYNAAAKASPETERLLRKAKAAYKQGIDKINTAHGELIIDWGKEGRFEQLATELLKPKFMNRVTISQLLDTVGPEGANNLRALFLDKMLEKAKTADGEFKPLGLAGVLKNMDRGLIDLVLGEDIAQLIDDISSIQVATKELNKTIGGSQTEFNRLATDRAMVAMSALTFAGGAGAQTLINMLTGGGAKPNFWALAAGVLTFFGREVYINFADSDLARKWKLEGFEFPDPKVLHKIGDVAKATPRQALRIGTRAAVISDQGILQAPESKQTIIRQQ